MNTANLLSSPTTTGPAPTLQITPTDSGTAVVTTPAGKYVQISATAGRVLASIQSGSAAEVAIVRDELGADRFDGITERLMRSGIVTPRSTPTEVPPAPIESHRRRRLRYERLTMIRFELLSGRRALDALARPWAALTQPAMLAVVIVVSILGLIVGMAELLRHGFSAGQNISALGAGAAVALIALTTIAHELGHGLELERRGGRAGGFGVMLLWFMPAAYCDVSNVWTIRDRLGRVAVSAAGPIVSLVAGGLAAVALQLGYGAAWLRFFVVANLIILAFNLSPFFRSDSYWMISHWLRRPRLLSEARHQARRMLRKRSRQGDGFSWGDAMYGAAGLVLMPLVVAAYWFA